MSDLQITYGDVPISYDERNDQWTFTLRGRDRIADSLAKAKEFIDKPVKESSSFKRVKALYSKYQNPLHEVEVTSIAGTGRGGRLDVWVMDGKERSKRTANELFAFTPENLGRAAQIAELDKQIAALEQQKDAIEETLDKLQIVAPE